MLNTVKPLYHSGALCAVALASVLGLSGCAPKAGPGSSGSAPAAAGSAVSTESDSKKDDAADATADDDKSAAEGGDEATSPTKSQSSSKSDGSSSASTSSNSSTGSSGGSSGSSKPSGGGSASSGGGSSKPSGGHTHTAQEYGHFEPVYTQVWVPNIVYIDNPWYTCNTCGAGFTSKEGFYAHSDQMYEAGESGHGGYTNNSYGTTEDHGHYEMQQTDRRWVVDGKKCSSCGEPM